jgi:hypothetical protein
MTTSQEQLQASETALYRSVRGPWYALDEQDHKYDLEIALCSVSHSRLRRPLLGRHRVSLIQVKTLIILVETNCDGSFSLVIDCAATDIARFAGLHGFDRKIDMTNSNFS